ncbi:MAG: cellulose binding domain-containing protein, partial [Micromonosporaceae bacterium]|nr:cellulose binding domain-containing protein [Micromonosporaceae bacterium]
MKRSVRRALLAGIVIAAAAATVPAIQAFGAGSVTATVVASSDWGTGHEAKVTVTNGSSETVGTWTIAFDLPAANAISSFWDADVVRTGDHYVATKKSWAGALAPGATQTWGYIAAGAFRNPGGCTINGNACAGGAAPTVTTSAPTQVPTSASPSGQASATSQPTATTPPVTGGKKVVGYFAEWGVYGRNYHVKNIETSGSAAKLTHIVYAFGNVTNGQCAIGDSYADYDKAYSAADSVDGVADTWDSGALRGSFGQLRKLKKLHPGLKVIWSFGGWTWSGGFGQAASNPSAFADSCYKLVEDSRWADVFDGIDIDWEYPNACGLVCDTSGTSGYKNLIAALRSRFGSSALVTSAITGDGSDGGKVDAADYAGAAQYLDWLMPMTYDYFGAWDAAGPTAPHAPLTAYAGIPKAGFNAEAVLAKLKAKGIPASKMLLGVGFYGRGWTGVTQAAPGGTATG